MKAFILALLFPLAAFAQIPPPVVLKSQGGQKQTFKYNLNVPNNGVTPLGGLDVLLETGAQNVLANPGFEANPQITGWTCANFTCANNTLYFSDGKQGMTVTNANTVNTVVEQSVTPTFPTANRPFQYGMFVNTNAAGFQVCSLFNGAEMGCADVPSTATTTFVLAPIYQPSTNGTVGVRLKSINANAKQVFFDGGYVGAVQLSSSSADSVWQNAGVNTITATTTAPSKGTTSLDRFLWRRNGSNLEGRIEFAQTAAGTAGSGEYLWGIPAATGCSIDTVAVSPNATTALANVPNDIGGVVANVQGSNAAVGAVDVYSSTQLRFHMRDAASTLFQANGSSYFPLSNASATYAATFSVPCAGWTPQTAIQTQNSNYDWRPYVPTFTGLGTVTVASPGDCQEKREGPDNLIRCKFTIGTPTAVEARMSLPYTIASTFSSIQYVAPAGSSASGTSIINALREPGVGYFTFGFSSGTTATLSKANGNAAFAAGQVLSIDGRYPVLGWSENQNAPQLIGSVLGGANITQRFFATYAGASSTTECAASGACTLYGSSGNLTVTAGTAGNYSASVANGLCSQPLVCSVTPGKTTQNVIAMSQMSSSAAVPSTTTSFSWYTLVAAGTAYTSFGSLTCDCVK